MAQKITEAEKNNTELELGNFKMVKEAVKKSFSPFDRPGDALEEIKKLQMNNDTNIDEHIAKFKMLVTQTGLSDSLATMEYFRETLPIPLQKQVMTCEQPPTTLEEWYSKSNRFHSNWKKMQRIFGRKTETNQNQKNSGKKFLFPKKERDPNAMDVDTMTTDERTQLMKKGACFRCKKVGHLSNDCPEKNSAQKKTGKDVYAQIRAMIMELPDEEKKSFMAEMEKSPMELDF